MPYLLNKSKEFMEKMKDPKERKFFAFLFGGKLLGILMVFTIISTSSYYFKAHAQDAPKTDA